MFDLNEVINISPFSLRKHEKDKLYFDAINELTLHHYDNCFEYRRILDALEYVPNIKHDIHEIPPIPVTLFKNFTLSSVQQSKIIKTMTSSGTTGQGVSKIHLDRETSRNQTRVLTKIVTSFTGQKRLPTLIIDSDSVVTNRQLFSARGAGILGFSMFGHDVTFALDENMQLDVEKVDKFCEKYGKEDVLIFGFTSIIWEHFVGFLTKGKKRLNLENGIMIHGGGWKKLNQLAVDDFVFKNTLGEVCGIKKIHNYYGMVEQTGSIFMECEDGYLHSSIFSDVVVRGAELDVNSKNKNGSIQLYSLLPLSYPGHVLLTEDVGEILGQDDCSCGRLGKYFRIYGRTTGADARGCSDTYESI